MAISRGERALMRPVQCPGAPGVPADRSVEQRSSEVVDLEHGLAFVSQLGVGPRTPVVSVRGLAIERTLAVVTKRGRPLSVAGNAFLRFLRRA